MSNVASRPSFFVCGKLVVSQAVNDRWILLNFFIYSVILLLNSVIKECKMAINLDKHREALIAAWKDVLDEKTDTDWYVCFRCCDLLASEIK